MWHFGLENINCLVYLEHLNSLNEWINNCRCLVYFIFRLINFYMNFVFDINIQYLFNFWKKKNLFLRQINPRFMMPRKKTMKIRSHVLNFDKNSWKTEYNEVKMIDFIIFIFFVISLRRFLIFFCSFFEAPEQYYSFVAFINL